MVTGSSVCKLASYGAIVSLSVTAIPAAREQVNALVKPWMCAGPSFFSGMVVARGVAMYYRVSVSAVAGFDKEESPQKSARNCSESLLCSRLGLICVCTVQKLSTRCTRLKCPPSPCRGWQHLAWEVRREQGNPPEQQC